MNICDIQDMTDNTSGSNLFEEHMPDQAYVINLPTSTTRWNVIHDKLTCAGNKAHAISSN